MPDSLPRPLPGFLAALALTALVGCAAAGDDAAARRIYVVDGFEQPESVLYDPGADAFFVSNMFGYGSVKDGRGYITRFAADDPPRIETFVEAGRNGATLHAPKGMTLQGDTLWVADIDALRGFDRRTGAPLATVDLAPRGAVLLNSLAVGGDGTIYATDSGIVMSPVGVLYPGGDKIFALRVDGSVEVVAEGPELLHPNGIRWDSAGQRLVVAGFNPFGTEVYALRPADMERTVLARGSGRFDGVQPLPGGRILYTSWMDSTLYSVEDGRTETVIRNLWQAADLGYDARRRRVAIPLVLQGRVEVWEVPDE